VGLGWWASRRAASKNAVVTSVSVRGPAFSASGQSTLGTWLIPVTYIFSDGTTLDDAWTVTPDVAMSPQLPDVVKAISSAFIGETRGQIESKGK
jgi:hypothetical protein